MTEIILARHGETEWNVKEIFRGRIDIDLNETGIKQAELLAKHLSDRQIESIYSSPLKRARQTAETIAGHHHLRVETTPGLIDLNYGKWQGLTHQEIKGRHKELYVEWLSHPDKVKIPDGESLSDIRERAVGVVEEVIAKHEGAVVLVSHRVVNKVLICALLGLDNAHFWNIRQDTGGMTTFTYQKERFILIEQNNTSYLKSIQKAPPDDF